VSVHFPLGLNTLQILCVPIGITVKRLTYGERGGCTSKTKCLVCGSLSQHLRYIMYPNENKSGTMVE